MAMDPTFAKLAALVVIGSVAKKLLDDRPVIHNHYEAGDKEIKADNVTQIDVGGTD